MKKIKEKVNRIVTVGETLKTEPMNVSDIPSVTRKTESQSEEGIFINPIFGLPNNITHVPDPVKLSPDFSLYVGVYMAVAPTGTGKSVATAALARWANDVGVKAAYFSVFEPRSPTWPKVAAIGPTTGAIKDFSQLISNESFSDPSQFWIDVRSLLLGRTPKSEPALLIFDSATDALKANAGERFRGQPTYEGGMQPSDRDFLITGSIVAKACNVCLVLVLNTTLIPYADRLHGACEGMITIKSVTQLSRTDRSPESARSGTIINLPEKFVQEALDTFGFGSLRTGNPFSNQTFIGV